MKPVWCEKQNANESQAVSIMKNNFIPQKINILDRNAAKNLKKSG